MPGLEPHPFRHPAGHLYTDGSAPAEAPWDPCRPWRQDPAWLWGCELYEQRFYWEAHEAWEALWHQVPRGSLDHTLLQGLIQAAACVLKHHLGHAAGARRLHARARQRLIAVVDEAGPAVRGLDLPACVAQLDAYVAGGTWPALAWVAGRPEALVTARAPSGA